MKKWSNDVAYSPFDFFFFFIYSILQQREQDFNK